MKKTLLFTICLLVGFTCFATIQNTDIQSKLITLIKSVKSTSVNTAIRLGNLKSQAQSIVAGWNSEINITDKANLQGLNALVLTAKNALDDVNDYIVLTWKSIE